MNDERVGKILDWLTDRITKVEGFVLEQAPDVVQQIITMDCVIAWMALIACCLGVIVCGVVSLLIWRSANKNDDPGLNMFHLLTAMPLTAFICIIVINAAVVAKTTFAPKAYLLERVGVLK